MEARWATAREMRKVYEDKARMVKCVRCVLAMRVDGVMMMMMMTMMM
jgi:hypothetical protein